MVTVHAWIGFLYKRKAFCNSIICQSLLPLLNEYWILFLFHTWVSFLESTRRLNVPVKKFRSTYISSGLHSQKLTEIESGKDNSDVLQQATFDIKVTRTSWRLTVHLFQLTCIFKFYFWKLYYSSTKPERNSYDFSTEYRLSTECSTCVVNTFTSWSIGNCLKWIYCLSRYYNLHYMFSVGLISCLHNVFVPERPFSFSNILESILRHCRDCLEKP